VEDNVLIPHRSNRSTSRLDNVHLR
jgi:hypothetical protein